MGPYHAHVPTEPTPRRYCRNCKLEGWHDHDDCCQCLNRMRRGSLDRAVNNQVDILKWIKANQMKISEPNTPLDTLKHWAPLTSQV